MARKSKKVDDEIEPGKTDSKDTDSPQQATEEKENWANKPESDIYEKSLKIYQTLKMAYRNREEADEANVEYWNIYNAQPDDNQVYNGNSRCYVPVVRDSINARSKRALKQLFPQKFTHVEAVGSDGDIPYPQLSMLEHYIRKVKLKSVCRSMLISGDVTGQWCLYVDWLRDIRNVSNFIRRNPAVEAFEGEITDIEEEEEVVEDEEIVDEGPVITDFAVEDMVIVPPTCNDVEKAEVVCIKLRMNKEAVERMVDEGIFVIPDESEIGDWIKNQKTKEKVNPPKSRASDAGIKVSGTDNYALIYEATVRFKVDGKKSLFYVYYAGDKQILGIIKAPQWGQKRPIITAPVERISGSAFGISKIEAVKWMQWNVNDFWNMGQDSAMYSLLPIVMTDPEKNPNYAAMVYGLAAVWPTSPESTKFANFPQLWKDSMEMVVSIKQQINESLDANAMMMGQMPKGRKNAGAVGAQQQEQSVSIIDHAERFEEEILNPLMERFFEYDTQFREEDLTVLTMGEIGVKAAMTTIPPFQWENRFMFQWTGTEYVMNMQRMQQQIATMNVLRGIPPQQLNGLKLNISPILKILTENVFGSELSTQILIDDKNKFTVSPEIEDEMMMNGIPVDVHDIDDDVQHLQVHAEAGKMHGDPTGILRTHMQAHMQQLQKKRQMAQAAMQPQPQQGAPGVPGGAGSGVAGTPRIGAQPQMPRPGQNPAGTIHPDAIAGGTPRG